jgi:hypothetical protein
MARIGTKYKRSIELFDERTGEVIRFIRFRNEKSFDEFIYGFKSMRYPGYGWRHTDKKK